MDSFTLYFEPSEYRRLSNAQQRTVRQLAKCEHSMTVDPRSKRTMAKLHSLGFAAYDESVQLVRPTKAGLDLVKKMDAMQVSAHNIMSAFAGKAKAS